MHSTRTAWSTTRICGRLWCQSWKPAARESRDSNWRHWDIGVMISAVSWLRFSCCSTACIKGPYLTLPYGEDVLPPSTEASNGPNAHPRINRKVTKSPSAVLTWVHTKTWNHPLPSEGLLTWTYPLTCTLSISKRTSAWKHISTSMLVTMTSKTPNQENPGDSSPNRA